MAAARGSGPAPEFLSGNSGTDQSCSSRWEERVEPGCGGAGNRGLPPVPVSTVPTPHLPGVSVPLWVPITCVQAVRVWSFPVTVV